MSQKLTLHEASKRGDVEQCNLLLNNGSNIEENDTFSWTPLHYAAYYSHIAVARLLLNEHCEVNPKNNLGQTPLHLATKNGDKEMCKLLLEKGADLKMSDQFDWVALHYAAEFSTVEVAEVLLKQHSDVNCRNDHGQTPLHLASKRGNLNMCIILLNYDSDIYSKDNYGWTPFTYATENAQADVVKLLNSRTCKEMYQQEATQSNKVTMNNSLPSKVNQIQIQSKHSFSEKDALRLSSLDPSKVLKVLGYKLYAEWKIFGIFLGIDAFLLDTIKKTYTAPKDCFIEVIMKWLMKEEGTGGKERTWQSILEAVKLASAESVYDEIYLNLEELDMPFH